MIELNQDQKIAVEKMLEFLASDERMFLLEGQAGTGKTTCIHWLLAQANVSVVLTAPTNKATKVLEETNQAHGTLSGVECKTTYSLLGLRVSKDSEFVRVEALGESDALNYQLVIVDEASMPSDQLFKFIDEASWEGVKFIFLGDPLQLPPVGQKSSKAMQLKNKCTLTKVERHDNQILTLATHLRKVMDGEEPLAFKNNHDEAGEGVYCVNYKKFTRLLGKAFTSESHTNNPKLFRCVAWRNSTVELYNAVIRESIHGEAALASKFLPDERVIATHPVMGLFDDAGEILMTTDQEATIQSVDVIPHPMHHEFKCYHLRLEPDFGSAEIVNAFVIHEDSEKIYAKKLGLLAEEAGARKGSWSSFWALKNEMFSDIRPSHAITAHRSQGSTYQTVFVDATDILLNKKKSEALKCLYVACTRASKTLVILTR
jgi:exodeoxyribonuclease-5